MMNKKILVAGILVSIMLLVPINSAYSNNGLSVEKNDKELQYDNILDDTWTKRYSFSTRDVGNSVKQTLDGGYIVAANWESGLGEIKYGSCIFKTDGNGKMMWKRSFQDDYSSNKYRAYSVIEDNNSNYVSTGRYIVKVWLLKYNKIGTKIFDKRLRINHAAGGKEIIQTFDDGYAIVGYVHITSSESYSVLLLKTDNNGNEIWNKSFDNEEYNNGNSIKQTSDGGYIIVGGTSPTEYDAYKTYLIRTDKNGTLLWEKTYGGNGICIGYSLDITNDNGYIITGYTRTDPDDWEDDDIWLLKTNENGDKLWEKTYGGKKCDIGNSVQTTDDGGYIIAGYTFNRNSDAILIKTDSLGNVEWSKTYGVPSSYEYARSIQQTNDGGYILTGACPDNEPGIPLGGDDVFLIKTDSNGNAPPLSKTRDIGFRNKVFDGSFLTLLLERFTLIGRLLQRINTL